MFKNFHMPAEWEKHEAIILSWPHNTNTWPKNLERVRATYLRLMQEIVTSEMVWLNVTSASAQIEVERLLILYGIPLERVRFFILPYADSWVRDYGPIYVVTDSPGKRARLITDWIFNGWGDKYDEPYYFDDDIPTHLARLTKTPSQKIDFILEGGSIDVNGRGALLTSSSCLLNSNRHDGLRRTVSEVEDVLRTHLGVKKVIWVDQGIAGDDTDGHIDDTVRFVNAHTVVCAYEENTRDENHAPLKAAYESLLKATDQEGRPLRVIKLPMPDPVITDGERLPASYANFLILNTKILVPIYGSSEKNQKALAILEDCFPARTVVGIEATDLVWGLGSFHCISQQVPGRVP